MSLTQRARKLILWLLTPSIVLAMTLGVLAWGAFNTAMEATNSMSFCISCHEMRENVYREYVTATHYRNPSGVRATCADCHVPRDWTHKLARKIQATRELFDKAIGTIDTPEKFAARRIDLARREWRRMQANGSRECRNCHAFEAMDFERQDKKASAPMRHAMQAGQSCIDCHKGIAHKLPDLAARHRNMRDAIVLAAAASAPAVGATVYSHGRTPVLAAAQGGGADAQLAALTPVQILAREGDFVKIAVDAWLREGTDDVLYARIGKRIPAARLEPSALERVEKGRPSVDRQSEENWTAARFVGWARGDAFLADPAALMNYGAEMNEAACSFCHALHEPGSRDANAWIGAANAMKRYVDLSEEEFRFLQKYLQIASDGALR